MDTDSTLADMLARYYGARAAALHPLAGGGGAGLYRVERDGQPPWLLRAAPPGTDPAAFAGDAAVLALLARHAYPAPRLVPTVDGVAVAAWESRPVLVTTFLAGEPLNCAPASLGRLGEMLGLLHALPLPAPADARAGGAVAIPPARMLPRPELAAARAWLAEVRDAVPRPHRARYEALDAACRTLDPLEDLPPVLLHNDCHPGNGLRTPDGGVALIDWAGAGRGAAVIDVGFLLVSGEITAFGPNRLPPDPARLVAIVDGYCLHHRLTAQEVDRLPDAIRFRAVIACADALRRMVRAGHADDGAAWAWARYAAAGEIAARATERFARRR